jgi:hypothetical protein
MAPLIYRLFTIDWVIICSHSCFVQVFFTSLAELIPDRQTVPIQILITNYANNNIDEDN